MYKRQIYTCADRGFQRVRKLIEPEGDMRPDWQIIADTVSYTHLDVYKRQLYDNRALEKLQQILLFRELEFSLKDIKQIMDAPGFDRQKALEQQIEVLILKKQRLENPVSYTHLDVYKRQVYIF